MPVHRMVAIPGKFKKRKVRDPAQPESIAERLKQMRDRRGAAKLVGQKDREDET